MFAQRAATLAGSKEETFPKVKKMLNHEVEIASGPMFKNSILSKISVENAHSRKYNSLKVLLGIIEKFPQFENQLDDRVNPAIEIETENGPCNVRLKTLASWMKKRADGMEWDEILQGRRGRVAKIVVPDFDIDDL